MAKDKYSLIENFKTGINAILPLIILLYILSWLIKLIFRLIQPFVLVLAPKSEDQTIIVKIAALFLVLFFIVFIGAMVQSPNGKRRFAKIEDKIFKILPGYSMVKETILRFIGTKRIPFSQVAIVNTFCNETRQIAFVTDENPDGSYTVFVPTGPNPTSGNIYVLASKYVRLTNIPADQAMKAIISCGIGSTSITKKKKKKST